MNSKTKMSVFLLGGFLLSACSTQPGQQNVNQVGGTVLGGAAGGLLGSMFGKGTGQLAATALGAVGGAALGNMAGSSMDQDANNKYKASQSPTVVYQQAPVYQVPADACAQYRTNEGAYAACQRGIAQKNAEIQRQLEQDAFKNGRK